MEKLQQLLSTQEMINKEYKADVDLLRKKLNLVKNDYGKVYLKGMQFIRLVEFRLEEQARLLDERQTKCARMEARLQELADGTITVPPKEPLFGTDLLTDSLVLEKGQNALEIQLRSVELNSTAIGKLRDLLMRSEMPTSMQGQTLVSSKSCDLLDPAHHLITFLTFDFLDFSTQVTPIAMGLNPAFNFTARFTVTVDDFFLDYLSKKSMDVEIHRSVGGDFARLGAAKLRFRDLVEATSPSSAGNKIDQALQEGMRYAVDICDGDTILGKLFYGLRARCSIQESIRTYHERNAALSLLQEEDNTMISTTTGRESNYLSVNKKAADVSSSDSPDLIPATIPDRFDTNELTVSLLRLENLVSTHKLTGVFVSFSFHNYGDFVTDTRSLRSQKQIESVALNNQVKIPVQVTGALDRFLRTQTLEVCVFGDLLVRDTRDFVLLGSVKIPLAPLSDGESLRGTWSLSNQAGTLIGSLQWSRPYRAKSLERGIRAPALETRQETAKEERPVKKTVESPVPQERHKSPPLKQQQQQQRHEAPAHPIVALEQKSISVAPTMSPPVLAISSVTFATPANADVMTWISKDLQVQQFFISFELDGIPVEHTETLSLFFQWDNPMSVAFEQGTFF